MSTEKLIRYINSHKWWRTALPDKTAIKARGIFFASSFKEAEFYGRPLDVPFRVKISNPLFGYESQVMDLLGLQFTNEDMSIAEQFELDATMMQIAKTKGYDSILLVTQKLYLAHIVNGYIPHTSELQVFS